MAPSLPPYLTNTSQQSIDALTYPLKETLVLVVISYYDDTQSASYIKVPADSDISTHFRTENQIERTPNMHGIDVRVLHPRLRLPLIGCYMPTCPHPASSSCTSNLNHDPHSLWHKNNGRLPCGTP